MKSDRFLSYLRSAGLPARAGLLAACLLVALIVVGPIAFYAKGTSGLLACVLAAFICLVPGLISLGLGELFRGTDAALYNLLFGTIVRLGLPLMVCVAIYTLGGPLAEGGFAFYLLAFYPVMLIVETVLLALQMEADATPVNVKEATHG